MSQPKLDRHRRSGVGDQAQLVVAAGIAVDVHLAGTEQSLAPEDLDLVRPGRVGDGPDVRGHEQIELARGLDLAPGVGQRHEPELGERDPHSERPAVGGEVLAAHAPRVGEPRVVVLEMRALERHRIEAIGEHRSEACLAQAAHGLVRVRGRVVAVGEVEHGRDAGVERLERADVVAGVDVLGLDEGREVEPDAAEVVEQGPVGADPAQRRLPGVAMGVHETRQHDLAGGVEQLAVGHVEVGLDRRDHAVLDEDVGFELREGAVHRDDRAAADEQSVARHRARI
jgi:hypothetical protein